MILKVGEKYINGTGQVVTVLFIGERTVLAEDHDGSNDYSWPRKEAEDSWVTTKTIENTYRDYWYKLDGEYVIHRPSKMFKSVSDFETWSFDIEGIVDCGQVINGGIVKINESLT